FYFLDVNSLTVDDINMILDHYKKIQQSRFYKFLLKECASNTSILMNLGNIILDRMMFYQTAIYLFMDFPPEIKKDEQAKRITEFFEELEHESRRQQLKTLDFDPSGLLEFRGKAQAKMAVITGNIRFYNQAIKSFWEALRQSSRLSVIKSLYETIGDFALASNNQELFFLSNVVRAVFYSTNLYWWIYGEKIEAYKNCRVEYKNKYNEKVKTLYDIKKIPNFFKSPMLSVEYEEKLRRKGAYGFILSMVPGMMLWLQFSKLVLTKNSPELHEIETDLYFAMKIEQEYYEDPKINDEWTQKAKKIYMEIDKVKAVKELLSSNRLL
ncbi:MAG: hypothetical protein QG635_832, partial [Bacteroidota bacterium]|nr:hypothetical protein [Bacteroidota bacterium]